MPIIASTIVEVCMFRIVNNQPQYLLLHRSKEDKIYPDIWQFVTGSIEGKETALEGALREIKEETGLVPQAVWVVPYVDTFYDAGWDSINLCPLFAVRIEEGNDPVLSPEHCEFGWFSYNETTHRLVWPGQREGLRIVHEYIVGEQRAAQLTRLR